MWSPEGERIAYASAGVAQASRVFIAAVNRRTDPQLLYARQHHTHLSDWSADGQWISAVEIHPENQRDIWALSADGSKPPISVALTQAWEHRAVFSPDGRWMAYASNETGRFEIYVVAFPDLIGKRQISSGGGNNPKWDPAGNALFYLNGDTLLTVTASVAGGSRDWERPVMVLVQPGIAHFEVDPNGQRFLLFTDNPNVLTSEIHVALNLLNR